MHFALNRPYHIILSRKRILSRNRESAQSARYAICDMIMIFPGRLVLGCWWAISYLESSFQVNGDTWYESLQVNGDTLYDNKY